MTFFESDLHNKAKYLDSKKGVFLLAGGKGTRLKNSNQEELRNMPKPLVNIQTHDGGRKPMIDVVVGGLNEAGFRDISVLTSDDPESGSDLVEQHLKKTHGNIFTFVREHSPLGTAGAIYNGLNYANYGTFIVTPADILFPFNKLKNAFDQHNQSGAPITWITTSSPGIDAQNSGKILVKKDGIQISHILEGTTREDDYGDDFLRNTSAGVVIANGNAFATLFEKFTTDTEHNGPIDLYRHLIPWALGIGVFVGTCDVKEPVPDLGTPQRLAAAGNIYYNGDELN